jgi:hypothetical protein
VSDPNLAYECDVCHGLVPDGEDECPHCLRNEEASSDEEKVIVRARPDISHLDMAVEVDDAGNVTFIPEVGQKVVIERPATCLPGSPWLDTTLYTVLDIDPETGNLKLWRDELGGFASSNYIEGLLQGYSFRLPPKKGPIVKRKLRVKRLVKEDTVPTVTVPPGEKRARGRPKGSKNRPKDVIKAEKTARVQARKSKVRNKR